MSSSLVVGVITIVTWLEVYIPDPERLDLDFASCERLRKSSRIPKNDTRHSLALFLFLSPRILLLLLFLFYISTRTNLDYSTGCGYHDNTNDTNPVIVSFPFPSTTPFLSRTCDGLRDGGFLRGCSREDEFLELGKVLRI